MSRRTGQHPGAAREAAAQATRLGASTNLPAGLYAQTYRGRPLGGHLRLA